MSLESELLCVFTFNDVFRLLTGYVSENAPVITLKTRTIQLVTDRIVHLNIEPLLSMHFYGMHPVYTRDICYLIFHFKTIFITIMAHIKLIIL